MLFGIWLHLATIRPPIVCPGRRCQLQDVYRDIVSSYTSWPEGARSLPTHSVSKMRGFSRSDLNPPCKLRHKVALHMFGPRKSACLANMAPMLLPQPWPQNRGEWCEGSGWSKMLLLVLGHLERPVSHPPSIFLLEFQCTRCAAPKASKTDRVTRSHHLRKRVCGLNRGPLRTKTQGIGSR